MTTGFITFQNYHQRRNIGSSRIRAEWVAKYMKDAEMFQQGKKYDAIVFQKAYWKEMAREFTGNKILDICDPDWLDGAEVVSFAQYMDAITVPTEALRADLERMTKKPVYVIPDREDLSLITKRKIHEGRAKKVVWFGYNTNLHTLEGTFDLINSLGLTLVVVTDGNLTSGICPVENIKWDADADASILTGDFALLPDNLAGRGRYKSNNKTVHAWALGLPVAKNAHDMERFMEESERKKEADMRWEEVKRDYDVKKSAQQMEEVIYGNTTN